MGRTIDLEIDLPWLLDRVDYENVSNSADVELSQRVRATFEEWKKERHDANLTD